MLGIETWNGVVGQEDSRYKIRLIGRLNETFQFWFWFLADGLLALWLIVGVFATSADTERPDETGEVEIDLQKIAKQKEVSSILYKRQ